MFKSARPGVKARFEFIRDLLFRKAFAAALALYSGLLLLLPLRDYLFSESRQDDLRIGNVPHFSP